MRGRWIELRRTSGVYIGKDGGWGWVDEKQSLLTRAFACVGSFESEDVFVDVLQDDGVDF